MSTGDVSKLGDFFTENNMGVEPRIGGKPPELMIYCMENPIKMDDLGVPLFLETPTSFLSNQPGFFSVFLKKWWMFNLRYIVQGK